MKKIVSLLLVVSLVATALVGCGGSKDKGSETSGNGNNKDSIVFAQGADPRGLDPALVDDGESSKVIVNVYEGLLQYAKDSTKVEPCLAESWDISEDGKEYTFKLKQGVKFHDGTDFNAEAVKFNIERQTINRVENMTYGEFVYEYVDHVEVVDTYTVKIVLTAECTPFLNNLAMSLGAPMVSPAACEKYGNNLNENPVGTGPYKFVRWDKAEAIVLERNDEYWGEKAATEKVVIKIIPDNSARVVALTNGEVDMIDGIDNTVVDQISGAGMTVQQEEGMNVSYLAYNLEKMNDPEVRKALSQAVNVPELVQSLYGEYASEATSILPSFMAGYSADVKQVAYNPEEAKATLEAKGIKELHMISYSNARPYNTVNGQKLAEAVQSYYSKVGVKVNLDIYDWATYKDRVIAGDFDICFYGWVGDNGDPDNFLNLLGSTEPSMNVSRYNDADYKAKLAQAVGTPNGEERNAIYTELEKKVAEEAIWLPISHSKLVTAYNPKVSNYFYHMTGNIFFSNTTVAK